MLPDCCKLLVNFQSSENVDSNIFASTLVAFMEERVFGDPHFIIFAGVLKCHFDGDFQTSKSMPSSTVAISHMGRLNP